MALANNFIPPLQFCITRNLNVPESLQRNKQPKKQKCLIWITKYETHIRWKLLHDHADESSFIDVNWNWYYVSIYYINLYLREHIGAQDSESILSPLAKDDTL